MSWVRLDDQWYDHPKLIALPELAQLLWVKGLTYAARYLTDGHLTAASADRLLASWRTSRTMAEKLVQAGLWEKTEAGFKIHDYEQYQPLACDVKAKRIAATQRMKRWRDGVTNAEQTPFVRQLACARPRAGSGIGSGSETATADEKPAVSNGEQKPRATVASTYDLAKSVWSELWAAKYGQPYIFAPSSGPGTEDYLLQRLGRLAYASGGAAPRSWLVKMVKSFLRDPGGRNWLVENKHPLRAIERDLNKYVESRPLKPRRHDPPPDETQVVPISPEEQAKRAESLAQMSKAIGSGGAK